jgi:hypothetical protein
VPGTPGADGNASAVAVCLECALLIRRHNILSVIIVLFNREEDGLLGSSDLAACFANNRREPSGRRIFLRWSAIATRSAVASSLVLSLTTTNGTAAGIHRVGSNGVSVETRQHTQALIRLTPARTQRGPDCEGRAPAVRSAPLWRSHNVNMCPRCAGPHDVCASWLVRRRQPCGLRIKGP